MKRYQTFDFDTEARANAFAKSIDDSTDKTYTMTLALKSGEWRVCWYEDSTD